LFVAAYQDGDLSCLLLFKGPQVYQTEIHPSPNLYFHAAGLEKSSKYILRFVKVKIGVAVYSPDKIRLHTSFVLFYKGLGKLKRKLHILKVARQSENIRVKRIVSYCVPKVKFVYVDIS